MPDQQDMPDLTEYDGNMTAWQIDQLRKNGYYYDSNGRLIGTIYDNKEFGRWQNMPPPGEVYCTHRGPCECEFGEKSTVLEEECNNDKKNLENKVKEQEK